MKYYLSRCPKRNLCFFSFPELCIKSRTLESALLQSCPTLCDPTDGSPPGSRVPGILQARTLEWVALSFSSAWKWKVKVKSLSRVRPSATPWTAAYQAPLSMGFSRQEYWSGVPLPSPWVCCFLSIFGILVFLGFSSTPVPPSRFQSSLRWLQHLPNLAPSPQSSFLLVFILEFRMVF